MVNLSPSDVHHLHQAMRALISPLTFQSVNHWRSAVNAHLLHLMQADSVGFMLADPDGPFVYSDEHDPAELAKYPEIDPPSLRDGTTPWLRCLDRGVTTIGDAYGADYDLYLKSPYFNEYAAPNGAFDTFCAALRVEGDRPPGFASLHFWHNQMEGRRFGEREHVLLQLLFPSFEAGVQAHLAASSYRTEFAKSLDGLDVPIMVYNADGLRLHQTPAMTHVLECEEKPDELLRVITNLVSGFVQELRSACQQGRPTSAHIPTAAVSHAGHRITVSFYWQPSQSAEYVVVAMERSRRPLLTDVELVALYGLTPAEIRVARFIVGGRSNKAISAESGITEHTVKRHMERIFRKLNVTSRSQAGAKLRGE